MSIFQDFPLQGTKVRFHLPPCWQSVASVPDSLTHRCPSLSTKRHLFRQTGILRHICNGCLRRYRSHLTFIPFRCKFCKSTIYWSTHSGREQVPEWFPGRGGKGGWKNHRLVTACVWRMLDILRMTKNEELAVKMIFSAEQPLTGMNEGTWFPRRMCRRIEGILM